MSHDRLPVAKYRTRQEIENATLAIIERHYPRLLEEPDSFPVEDLLEFVLPLNYGIEMGVKSLPSGYEAITMPGSATQPHEILLEERVYKMMLEGNSRARFTAAHEAGHAIMHADELHQTLVRGHLPGLYRRSSLPFGRDPERQANIFAGFLLVPTSALRVALGRIGPTDKFGPRSYQLARIFNVGETAIQIRLEESGAGK